MNEIKNVDEVIKVLTELLLSEDRGQPIDRFSVLQQNPSYREPLMQYFETVDEIERMAGPTKETIVGKVDTAAEHSQDQSIFVPDQQFGRYKIIETLGKGGMGTVYLAEDTVLDRKVALKIPRFPDDQSELVERFYREAKAAAVIQHRNICPVFDIGKHQDRRYITMAYIDGKILSEFIDPNKLPSDMAVAKTVRKLALALDEAHRMGIVHRDLKPSNIMIDSKNEPVLMDFGLARHASLAQSVQLTQSGMIVGTPAYMSPEQVRNSAEVGPPADIYSLGVIMYEMLTGETPFEGDIVSVITKIVMDEPEKPTLKRKSINPELEKICLKAMEKEPEDRFASMADLADSITTMIKNRTATFGEDTTQAPPVQAVGFDTIDIGPTSFETYVTSEEDEPLVTAAPIEPTPKVDKPTAVNFSAVVDIFDEPPPTDEEDSFDVVLPGPAARSEPESSRQNEEQPDRESDSAAGFSPKQDLPKSTLGKHAIPGWVYTVAASVFVFFVLLSIVVFLLPTSQSVLRVEINDPSIDVVITSNNSQIKGADQTKLIKVKPDVEQSLKITHGKSTFETESFMVGKGDTDIIKVQLIDGQVVVLRDGQEIRLKSGNRP